MENKPYYFELMLRIFILQNLYDFAGMKVIDRRAFSDFCGVYLPNQVPNRDTIVRFRNILESNKIQDEIFAEVVKIFFDKGLILKRGTIVDSTLITAVSSTKNAEKKRDPGAKSVKNGNNSILTTRPKSE